jgi:hypothetical protein
MMRGASGVASTALKSLLLLAGFAFLLMTSHSVALTSANFTDEDNASATVSADTLQSPELTDIEALILLTGVTLEWSEVEGIGGSDFDNSGYRLYRSVNGGAFTLVEETGDLTADDTPGALEVGTIEWVVRSFLGNWESADSNIATCTVALVILVPLIGVCDVEEIINPPP